MKKRVNTTSRLMIPKNIDFLYNVLLGDLFKKASLLGEGQVERSVQE